jgi:hypothetical protein
MVIKNWAGYDVQRWKSFVLQEKLKLLKVDIKKWVMDNIGVVDKEINDLNILVADSDKVA